MLPKMTLVLLVGFLFYRVSWFCDYNLFKCYRRYKFYRIEDLGSKYKTLVAIRSRVSQCYDYMFDAPQNQLLLGMVLGIDEFNKVPDFKKALKDTGTVHAVVVSGYNMNLVFSILVRIFGGPYSFIGVTGTLVFGTVYAVLSGFEPPVMRALLMSVFLLLNTNLGRSVSIYNVLFLSAWVLIVFYPNLVFNLSFLLSFGASLSLICFSEPVEVLFRKGILKYLPLRNDIVSTISAQILIWPLLSLYFGSFNVVGFITNPLLLWSVPLSTIGGGVVAFLCFLPEESWGLIKILTNVVSVPTWFFSYGVTKLSYFSFLNQKFNLGLTTSLFYYLILWIVFLFTRIKRKK